jgi:MFS family permease
VRKKLPKFENAYHRLVASQLIGEATLIYPLYSIMFSDRSNISAAGVGALLAVWQITQILSEVPTGIIADKFSKKYSIMAGRLLKSLCFVFWFFTPNFAGYMAGFIIWGIGEAFISGATQAYLYELNEGRKDSNYLKSYSQLKSLEMMTYTVTYFVTFLIGPKYQLLIVMSVVSMVISSLIAATLPVGKIFSGQTVRGILGSAVANISLSKSLKRKFAEALIVGGMLGMLVEMIVVNYRDYGASTKVVPLLISISTLVTAISFWLLHYYKKFFEKHVIALLIFFTLTFIVMFNMSMWWQIFGLFFVGRFVRVLAVKQEADMLEDIDEKSRATVLSSYSLAVKLLSALQIFFVGFFAINNNINLPTFWLVNISMVLFAVLYLFNSRNNRVTK